MKPTFPEEMSELVTEIAERTGLSTDDAIRGVTGVLEICRDPAEVTTLAREFIRSTAP